MEVSPDYMQLAIITVTGGYFLTDTETINSEIVFIWKVVTGICCLLLVFFFAKVLVSLVSKMDVDVAIAKLARPTEPQQPHAWAICQVEANWNFPLLQPRLTETTRSTKIWM